MKSLQGTVESCGRSEFLQGQIILLGQQGSELLAVAGDDHGLAAGETVPRSDVAGAAALLEEFFDQPQRHPEAAGDFLPGALVVVISGQDAFA